MGPLALMAANAGHEVMGSDLTRGAIYDELVAAGIEVKIGKQDGGFLRECLESGVDWFVYTSALAADHPELVTARAAGVKCTKRDDLTAFLVEELGLKMVAVAGTHGKTTTTSMIVWACRELGLPAAYIVGTTLGFAVSGAYHEGDEFFVYEADEYDRNFLKYHPWLAVMPYVSYDHPDIYPTREDYEVAFVQFAKQSERVIMGVDAGGSDGGDDGGADYGGAGGSGSAGFVVPGSEVLSGADTRGINLPGVRRDDAALAVAAIMLMAPGVSREKVVEVMNRYPGVGRRFERLADGIYTDYAHHPEEIAATVGMALEQARLDGKRGVVVVYQPHQNTRQHEVRSSYADAFSGVAAVYWLPTYLTRENPELMVLTPEELSRGLTGVNSVVTWGEADDALFDEIMRRRDEGDLVVLMTAGPADGWLRGKLGV